MLLLAIWWSSCWFLTADCCMIEMVAGETNVEDANKNVHFLCIIEVKSGKIPSNYSSWHVSRKYEASLCIVILIILKVTVSSTVCVVWLAVWLAKCIHTNVSIQLSSDAHRDFFPQWPKFSSISCCTLHPKLIFVEQGCKFMCGKSILWFWKLLIVGSILSLYEHLVIVVV